MSLINDDFLGLREEKSSSSGQKKNISLPLTQMEIKAFEGLCAMEGKEVKDKLAELIKNYIEKKTNFNNE